MKKNKTIMVNCKRKLGGSEKTSVLNSYLYTKSLPAKLPGYLTHIFNKRSVS